jgi:hypothetical protein
MNIRTSIRNAFALGLAAIVVTNFATSGHAQTTGPNSIEVMDFCTPNIGAPTIPHAFKTLLIARVQRGVGECILLLKRICSRARSILTGPTLFWIAAIWLQYSDSITAQVMTSEFDFNPR